jgi:hypothetical protein
MNTEERIKEILESDFLLKVNEVDKAILKLQLETLVVQSQLEELRKEKL